MCLNVLPFKDSIFTALFQVKFMCEQSLNCIVSGKIKMFELPTF